MKKIAVLLLAGLLSISFTACSSNEETSSVSSDISETESSVETGEIGDLLMNSFGKLFTGSTYYIDVNVVSESYLSESDSSSQSINYSYEIGIDIENEKAGMNISTYDGQNVSMVIKDGVGYEISHDDKKITTHTSDIDVAELGKAYTTYVSLGSLSGVSLSTSGITTYNGTECDFERYIVVLEETSETNNATITYYFKDGTPVAEVMESASGKVTFTLNKVSDKIDESIFDIPDEYETVSGDTSSETSSS